MSFLRPVIILIVPLCLLTLLSSAVNAQAEKLDFQVGEKVEVEDSGTWYEGKVTEIMPGGLAARVNYVDGKEREWNWMFVSGQIRKIRKSDDAVPDTTSRDDDVFPGDLQVNRIWQSADGEFSTEAQLVSKNGDNIKLLKSDGLEITVPLQSLSPADVRFVDQVIGKNVRPANDDPFAESDEDNPFREIEDSSEKSSERESDTRPDAFPPSVENRSRFNNSPGNTEHRSDRNSDAKKSPTYRDNNERPADKVIPAVPERTPDSITVTPSFDSSSSKPNPVKPVETPSMALWRWITFGSLFGSGLAVFIWGFVNRKVNW